MRHDAPHDRHPAGTVQLNDLPDDSWTKLSIEFSADAADAVWKSLVE